MKYYAVRKGHHPRIIAGEWKDAEPQIKKEISGFRNPEWKGFKTKAEADAYMAQGSPANPAPDAAARGTGTGGGIATARKAAISREDVSNPEDALAAEFKFTADAVVFVDGSRNFDHVDFDHKKPNRKMNKNKSFYYGSYGIVIFYRDGSVYIENARVEDGDAKADDPASITVAHHSFTIGADRTVGEVSDITENIAYIQRCRKKTDIEFDDKFVLASWNIAGEVEGVRRALDICFHQKNLDNAYVFFDCDQIDIVKKIQRGDNPALNTNVTYNYGEFCKKIVREKKHVGTMHIYSHDKGRKKGIHYDGRLELFNSCADVLAKAETYNKPIDPIVENKPLAPYGLLPFQQELAYSDDLEMSEIAKAINARRTQAFELIKKVVMDPKVQPKFV